MTEETLFIVALEIPDAAGRSRFLDRACGGDAALRSRLERLLGRHERAGCFLARPATAALDTESPGRPGGVPTEAPSPGGLRPEEIGRPVNS